MISRLAISVTMSVASLAIVKPLAAETPKERHNFPISIANPAPVGSVRSGPLFQKVNQLAYSSSKTAMLEALSPDAEIILYPKKLSDHSPSQRKDFLLTLLQDCQGPYAIDEGASWVQTSFVCHVGNERLIKNYFAFEESPEISVEFTFKNGRISKIYAADLLPLPMPGKSKYLPMNAAETIPDER